jgi:transposase-like protein
MVACPHCSETNYQRKNGFNPSGSQRYYCNPCRRIYTPDPKRNGHPLDLHDQAVRLYADGLNFRRIARILGVNHQTVINWVNAHTDALPPAPLPDAPVETIEQDERFTFVGSRKAPSPS